MATTAAVARNLLRNSKSLPQILRGQNFDRSNINVNINNMAKDYQIVPSLFVSNQKLHPQIPLFYFSEMGSFLGSSSGEQILVQKGDGRPMSGLVVETRGKRVVKDEAEDDGELDDEDGEFDDVDDFEDVEDFDEDDVDDDDYYGDEREPVDYDGEDKKKRRKME